MRRTIVELDLIGFSDTSKQLEEAQGPAAVAQLCAQIQEFIDQGLTAARVERDESVFKTTGDGALLAFEAPEIAHRFAATVHQRTQQHNRGKTLPIGRRVFRIGIATGDVESRMVDGRMDYFGDTVSRACRLEAKAQPGGVMVDAETHAGFPADVSILYVGPQMVEGKRDERYQAYAWQGNSDGAAAVPRSNAGDPSPKTSPAADPIAPELAPVIEVWQRKLAPLPPSATDNAQQGSIKKLSDQHKHALDLLSKPEAEPLRTALASTLNDDFDVSATSADELVSFLASLEPERAVDAFVCIRRALAESQGRTDMVEAAAIALYFLVACGLVDCGEDAGATLATTTNKTGRVMYAVIATALFGGKFMLTDDGAGGPVGKNVFEIKPPAGAEGMAGLLQSAYGHLFAFRADTSEKMLGAPTDELASRLESRVRSIRRVQRESLVFVVEGDGYGRLVRDFAQQIKAPTLMVGPDPVVTLLGVSVLDLQSEIAEFWNQLSTRRNKQEDQTMSKNPAPASIQITMGDGGNLAITQGAASPANASRQAGGAVSESALSELKTLLTEINTELHRQRTVSNNAELDAPIQATEIALRETASAAPKPERLRNAAKAVEDGLLRSGKVIDAGGKIAELVRRMFELVL